MATPQEKLAQSLEVLKVIQDKGHTAISTKELSRLHRERLLDHGFIKEVIQGWYIIVPPDEQKGDSTSWYASYWNFCARYLETRFGENYCISAEQSLQIHAGNTTVPQQLIIRTIKDSNAITPLVHGTSLFSMKSTLPNKAEIETKDNIRMLKLASSLVNCTPTMFIQNSIDMRTALAMIQDSSEILGVLLEGGHTKIAGRLAGAFRNIGRERIANDIVKTMKTASYDILTRMLERYPAELEFLAKREADAEKQLPADQRNEMGLIERLRFVTENPFIRITYTEAIDLLRSSKPYKKKKFKYPVEWGVDLQSEHERWLVEKKFKQPVILTDYPAEIKAFYMRANDDGKTVAAMDVLVPVNK